MFIKDKSDVDEELLREKFKKREIRQYLMMVIIPILYLIMFVAFVMLETKLGKVPKMIQNGMCILIIAPIIYCLFNYRCPKCGMFLGKEIFPKYCQNCGFRLS